ncbi:anti-sigma factor family protein [Rhodopirellula sp. MGV]|uniref:anti-sigma factor family protein n=1 Tax=Rhodopirellula sp. MGV TaxID=2023130 RepID=UPI000B96A3B4|nr:zf-HC2 domain-containing protein [Rhodopirellula sp. MGV]OYP30310.1 hypothetical protein CGZ80_22730 [Rhodopirellula sp. MGV]
MNCDQFEERLNELLDQRLPIEGDAQLARHVRHCDRCNETYRLWAAIEIQPVEGIRQPEFVSERSDRAGWLRVSPAARRGLVLAAALLVAVGVRLIPMGMLDDAPVAIQNTSVDNGALVIAQSQPVEETVENEDVLDPVLLHWQDSADWWNFVDEEAFVATTKPAFESVRLGVEPIGRSMKRAFAILIFQPTHQVEVTTPEQTPVSFREQTSLNPIPASFGPTSGVLA